jgi:hypothetical protein
MFKALIKFLNSDEKKERIAKKWMDVRAALIKEKFALVEKADVLTDRTYYRAMAAIKHRLNRVNKLLEIAEAI